MFYENKSNIYIGNNSNGNSNENGMGGKLNLILRHLHTDLNTDKGTEKTKKNPPFILALICAPTDEFR